MSKELVVPNMGAVQNWPVSILEELELACSTEPLITGDDRYFDLRACSNPHSMQPTTVS